MKHVKGYLAMTCILVLALSAGCTGANDNDYDENNNLNSTGSGITSSGALNNRYNMSADNTNDNAGLFRTNDYNINNQITPYNTPDNTTGTTPNNTITTRGGVNTNIGSAYNQ